MTMSKLMDLLDDFVFGPMNVINEVGGMVGAISKSNMGHRFALVRPDKYEGESSPVSANYVFDLLNKWHIKTYRRKHDSEYIYFNVSYGNNTRKPQHIWAEYIMLRNGVPSDQLHNPTEKWADNERWAANRQTESMERWQDKPSSTKAAPTGRKRSAGTKRRTAKKKPVQRPTGSLTDRVIDRLFD